MKKQSEGAAIDIAAVQSRMLTIRNQQVLLDRDVAALYGVQTREVNQAIRNNPGKFPEGYILELTKEESDTLRSKFLILEGGSRRGRHSKYSYKAFTEKGLYMLATILKGELAVRATLSIIETYAKVRSLKRELLELHKEEDRRVQASKLRHFGETLADIVMPDLGTVETGRGMREVLTPLVE